MRCSQIISLVDMSIRRKPMADKSKPGGRFGAPRELQPAHRTTLSPLLTRPTREA